jgi:glycosyltransferase involved in cell wall biosynthesis
MVSIIVPHYNRSSVIKDTVNSVLSQNSPDWELIIVDDGSDEKEYDSIKLLANKDSRIRVYSRISDQKGPSACRNEAVAMAKGEWLIFLDSDDALAPFCVEQRQSLMNENSRLDMGVFLMQEFTNKPGDNQKIYNNASTNENRVNCFLEGNNPWAVTCPIWRKDFFIQTGRFDPSFFYMEDPELHVRALLQDNMMYKTFYDYPADCYYRTNFHDDTKKHFYENSIRYRIQFYKKMDNLISSKPALFGQYKNSFNQGVINFFNHFLLSRVKEFPALQQEFIQWANRSPMLFGFTLFRFKVLTALFTNDNVLFKKLRLKGLALKLLMPKL